MADVARCLEDARKALVAGNAEAALAALSAALTQFEREGPEVDDELYMRVQHLVSLAEAAAKGVADARAYIDDAVRGARIVTTYDDHGKATAVAAAKASFKRF